jgi:hypothetical protein
MAGIIAGTKAELPDGIKAAEAIVAESSRWREG